MPLDTFVNRTVLLLVLLGLCRTSTGTENEQWNAPTGIPVPTFGIAESHHIYQGIEGYNDAGDGPYTIYIDNTAPDCSNSGPGTAASPRCDIPVDIAEPGTVVEVHGGPYDFDEVKQIIDANGSVDKPVILRGVDTGQGFPLLDNADTFAFQGQYFIVENLRFERTSVRTGAPGELPYGRHHIALRNLKISRHPDKNATAIAGEHIVFYNNHVHHNFGDDRHGTTIGRASEYVWIVDNYYHHNGGDAIQFCHGCRKNPPRNIFIGRNRMHSDRENAVDLKFGKYIIISENTMYGYKVARPDTEWCFDDDSYCGRFSSGSDGSAIIVGSDGAPKNPWIIYNNIYKSSQGIRVEEVRSAWIIGNTIHGISNRAIALEKRGDPLHILGNIIHDADTGIDQYWRKNFALEIHANVFANIHKQFLNIDGRVAPRSSIQNNIFWNSDDRIRINWGRGQRDASVPGPLEIKGGNGAGNRIENPGISVDDDSAVSWSGNYVDYDDYRRKLAEQDAVFKSYFGDEVSIIRDRPSGL